MPRKPINRTPIPTCAISMQVPLSLLARLAQRAHRMDTLSRSPTLAELVRDSLEELAADEWLPTQDISTLGDVLRRAGLGLPARVEMRKPTERRRRRLCLDDH